MTRVAIYARVSSDRQEQEDTIQSQIAALRRHAAEKGYEVVAECLDEGYSGTIATRPQLDRLRDLARTGAIDVALFNATDRLARSQVLLLVVVDELRQAGVRPEFVNLVVDDTPVGQLALGFHGLFSEYYRLKVLEDTRRGKLFWARQGALVGGHAPYGYRFVRRSDHERARLDVDETQAVVVRRMFGWLVDEHLSVRGIALRLTGQGVATSRGAAQWQPTAVDRILRNAAYKGILWYQRTQGAAPAHRITPNAVYRQHLKTSSKPRPVEDWIAIPVPVIVAEAQWGAAQLQLGANSRYAARNNTRHPYLLRGLVRCAACGGSYVGFTDRGHRGYRCGRTAPTVSSTGQRCRAGRLPGQELEETVWALVTEALRQPKLLVADYERRRAEDGSATAPELARKQLTLALKRGQQQEDRLTVAYMDEALDLDRYKAEMTRLRQRRQELERSAKDALAEVDAQQANRDAVADIERFCRTVTAGVEAASFEERQQILRLVVEQITVADKTVRVETIIPTGDTSLRTRRPELVEGRSKDGSPNMVPFDGAQGRRAYHERIREHSPRMG